ncbi:MAG: DUF4331 family protein [Sandaracinaceae bacterium]|nr:DUF4331 family protein [Sandaracinaceae bacterium]
MKTTTFLLSLLALAGCDSAMPMVDGSPPDAPMNDGFVPPTPCQTYCMTITTNCTGDNAQYADMADCLDYCNGSGWPDGTAGAQTGNSIACRTYHGGDPAASNPAMHCPHAGPTGAGVCGTVGFSGAAANTFVRVDGMGMPAVSTALISSGMKNGYNDAAPDSSTFTTDIVTNLTILHAALDDDLTALSLIPCVAATSCAAQGAPLVIPDVLRIDPAMAAGFPNGRQLSDRVIDITLAVILLDLGMGGQTTSTLVDAAINPDANDVAFLTSFPYVAPAHSAP